MKKKRIINTIECQLSRELLKWRKKGNFIKTNQPSEVTIDLKRKKKFRQL